MSKNLWILIFAALAPVMGGCIPSDTEIASEMSAVRREAYLEWKSQRERGISKQARVDGPLTLDDAIKVALLHNKQLQVAVEEREVTRGQRIATYAVVLPTVTLSGSATRIENGRNNTSGDIDSYGLGFRVTQPIFEGGAIPAQLRRARFYTALTDEAIRTQVQNLIAVVAAYYYDVLLAQHMVEVQREALVSAETQYRMVSERRKQETATDYDVLRAQVDVANYQAQMISAQNDIDTNRVYLLRTMGVSQDSEIIFTDTLEFLPMRPVFERAVELAYGNRPDIRTAYLESRVADEAVRISQSAFWPTLAATFDQNWTDGWNYPSDSFGRTAWQAGVSAGWTFGIDRVGNLHSARAQARQRQIDILDTYEQAMEEIRFQMNNLNNSEEQVNALVINQDAARESLRLVEVGYQAGVRTEVDITDARKALTEVMGQYYSALNQHSKARLNLQLAMGVLGPACITDGPIIPPTVPIANIEEFAATDYVPPTPLPIPTSERERNDGRTPERRFDRPSSRTTPPSSSVYEPLPLSDVRRDFSNEQRPAITPPVVDTAPVSSIPAPTAQPVMAPSQLPLPPAPSTGQAAVSVRPPAEPMPPQQPAVAQEPTRPMFKVSVRQGNSAPDMASLDQ